MALEMHVHRGPDNAPTARPPRRRRRARGVVIGLLAVGLVLGVAAAVANAVMVGRLERIDGAFVGLAERPADAPGRTVLLVGTRSGSVGGSDVPWLEDAQSIESVMLVEVADDGLSVHVETLPVRSGASRAAVADQPSETVAAVESWSGRRVNHLVAIDWATFGRLGAHNGVDAAYAYGSGPATQHAYLRQVLEGTLHAELRSRPLDLYRALSTTIDGAAVDDEWSAVGLDLMVLSLRDLRSHDITFGSAHPD